MKDYGAKIAELRKSAELTQSELGKQLNVTAQAVYKWEKGLSEPDIETINKICSLFNITANEFFETCDNVELQDQVAVTSSSDEPEETTKLAKNVAAYCEKCNAPCSYGEYKFFTTTSKERHGRLHTTVSHQHTYCNSCYEEYTRQQTREEQERKRTEALNKAYEINKSLRRGIILGSIALIIAVLIFIICKDSLKMKLGGYIALTIISSIAFGTFIAQCFWDSYVLDILDFFAHSFRLPGFIFSLDLESIVSMILIKITLSVLFSILSFLLFMCGVAIASACALFSFPFALSNLIREKRNLYKITN